ncbi:hypothetical protein K523DRAFT_323021 [Schizophyllum commune Tattone D]|nr:hypothetical protein K523DRAFT_323021 [Schizophyllum commune Tattone D]
MAQSRSDLAYELHLSVCEVFIGRKSYGTWYGVSRKRCRICESGRRCIEWSLRSRGGFNRRPFCRWECQGYPWLCHFPS